MSRSIAPPTPLLQRLHALAPLIVDDLLAALPHDYAGLRWSEALQRFERPAHPLRWEVDALYGLLRAPLVARYGARAELEGRERESETWSNHLHWLLTQQAYRARGASEGWEAALGLLVGHLCQGREREAWAAIDVELGRGPPSNDPPSRGLDLERLARLSYAWHAARHFYQAFHVHRGLAPPSSEAVFELLQAEAAGDEGIIARFLEALAALALRGR